MTVAEFTEAVEGYRWRQERQDERDAWIVCHLLKPHLKKGRTLDVEDLLGRPVPGARRRRVQSWDEVEAVLGGEESQAAARRQQVEAFRAARGAKPLPAGP